MYSSSISSQLNINLPSQSLINLLAPRLVSLLISHGTTKTSLLSSNASCAVISVHDFSHASVIIVHLLSQAIISFLIGKLYGSGQVHNLNIETIAHQLVVIFSYIALLLEGYILSIQVQITETVYQLFLIVIL